MADDEFTIRINGTLPQPPPPPSTKSTGRRGGKSAKGAGSKKSQQQPPLQQQQQQQRRYNLRLRPSTSLQQLEQDVRALFNVPKSVPYKISFLGGFPPKPLDSDGKSTVQELGIRANESVIVKFEIIDESASSSADVGEGKGSKKKSKKGDKKDDNNSVDEQVSEAGPIETTSSSRPKRASAIAATASFRDTIAAQDEIMKKESKPTKKITSTTTSGGINQLGSSPGKRKNNSATVTAKGGGTKKVKIEGTGYRLSDGKTIESATATRRSARKQNQEEAMFKSEDDIASSLLSSLGGSSGGNVGKFLRAAMKGAVAKSYEASRAGVRVAAVNQGHYRFEKVRGGSAGKDGKGVVLGTLKDHESAIGDVDLNDDNEILGRTKFAVSYSKGIEGRGHYTEQVEIIGLDVLKGVISTVYNTKSDDGASGNESDSNSNGKEMLRPVSIAQLSPRIFWSLVFQHYVAEKKRQKDQKLDLERVYAAKPSVEDMLRETMPHLDWSHLDRGGRKRELSEKAKENLRQEREETSLSGSKSSEIDQEEGVKAIEEMENTIMDTIMSGTNGGNNDNYEMDERERRAKAAMARFGNLGDDKFKAETSTEASSALAEEDSWELVTPSEDDIDELVECILEGLSNENGANHENYGEQEAKIWAEILLEYSIESTASKPGSVRNWRELANVSPEDISQIIATRADKSGKPPPPIEAIEKWVDAAQQRSMEEIMLEILDGDLEALDVLVEKARSGCPKDLSYWCASPKSLLDAISETGSSRWDEKGVLRWTRRARAALISCPWLDLYTTPVS